MIIALKARFGVGLQQCRGRSISIVENMNTFELFAVLLVSKVTLAANCFQIQKKWLSDILNIDSCLSSLLIFIFHLLVSTFIWFRIPENGQPCHAQWLMILASRLSTYTALSSQLVQMYGRDSNAGPLLIFPINSCTIVNWRLKIQLIIDQSR